MLLLTPALADSGGRNDDTVDTITNERNRNKKHKRNIFEPISHYRSHAVEPRLVCIFWPRAMPRESIFTAPLLRNEVSTKIPSRGEDYRHRWVLW